MTAILSPALIDAIARTSGPLGVSSAPDGVAAPAFAGAARLRGGVSMFVAREESRAAAFEAAVKFFTPDLETTRLPAWDSLPYDRISPTPAIAAQRCAVLTRLATRKPDAPALLVVTTASAVAQRVPPRGRLAAGAFSAHVGAMVTPEEIEAYAQMNGYGRASTVRAPGDYAMRGGVLDIFAPGAPEPLRFDFFGDQLETIRAFDPETQRSTRQITQATLTPVSEILFDGETIGQFRRTFAQSYGAVSDLVYDSVSARIRRQGVEQWLPFFYERLETVFDYVGESALIGFEHLAEDSRRERVEQAQEHYDSRANAPVPRGSPPFRAPPPPSLYLQNDDWERVLHGRATRRFNPFDAPAAAASISLGARTGRNFAPERNQIDANVFDAAREHINAEIKAGKRVLFGAWTDGSAERLAHVLSDHGLSDATLVPTWTEALSVPAKRPLIAVLPLEQGFETETISILSEQDLLGDRLARPRRKRKASSLIAEAAALSPGDLVVHSDHGVARYEGLKTLDVQGAPHDCLDLSYHGGDKLYLPVENIELVSRYGSEDVSAQLDKLGGVAWQSRKARAKQRLRDMAEELIRIAAARAARSAEAIEPHAGMFDEFCARFPYEETEDQLGAIEDAIGDLGSGKPMDRLVCGDVGFGKTEVALRAAFVVAMTGRQVAIVAPTTLLCRQHYRTFQERFHGLPVKIRQLSRLVTAKEAAETKQMLTDGSCDIIIGTHALLGKGIAFKDLGLLVIDEEQHFGVRHKERLKELRADVHVLTLSATPIPRTLQLALSGIREMSVIATPPIDRMAVRTYVTPFDPLTIREALLRERYRGGQSFYVVPRISDLEDAEKFLRLNAPELKFVVAHGQMGAAALDDVMTAFYDGQYDVLVSTTIIESGLDIPRANTMIVHRADMFGLAQLYQMRGRVGRSKVRAYAYLTTDAEKPMTAGAEKRLRVLSSLDNLGAGFTLASHDLDMRGGGNLLGEEQSGQIKEVGVELYQSMLEDAVMAIKEGREEVGERQWSPQINVGASVLIPEEYVPDLTVRLSLYRRLAELAEDNEREAFAAEMIDRFGTLPTEADQLIAVAGLKALCRQSSIAKLDAGPKGAVLTFRDTGFPEPIALVRLVQSRPMDFKMRPDGKLVIQGEWPDPALRLKALRAVLESVAMLTRKAAA
ncbi:MAG: transcription-repair coupling factor [Hyphomonadaceae bacterium]|nr:MAG: transcription-repair coupling factor (superfamily II helicase) [Caulobacteraceae bacterium]MBT9445134.1 transcription-repair coupling factor [Hyphomonadaceae bacterium]TPW08458.1 MAG: transcription-repair coupling factor (superfamily II helicase) [Alphaproteobacteria bacterium]